MQNAPNVDKDKADKCSWLKDEVKYEVKHPSSSMPFSIAASVAKGSWISISIDSICSDESTGEPHNSNNNNID